MKNKIKVVYVVENLDVGGIERVIETFSMSLDKNVFDVFVLCLCSGGSIFKDLLANGVRAQVLGLSSSKDVGGLFRLIRTLKSEAPDIVHTHGVTANGFGRLAAKLAGVKKIFAHVHTTVTILTAKQKLLYLILNPITCKIICCSHAVAESVKKEWPSAVGKVSVLYNGVDPEIFCRQAGAKSLGKEAKRVGCVASLYAHKGHRYLVEAAKIFREEYKVPIKFIFVGRGILLDDLKKQVKELDLEDTVIFHDVVSDIGQLINWFDIVVLPSSTREGLGIALIEAMAASIPVVGSDIGGIPEVIKNGVNGYLVPPKEPRALAKAIFNIIDDEDMAKKMGKAGVQIVRARFSNSVLIKELEFMYKEAIM